MQCPIRRRGQGRTDNVLWSSRPSDWLVASSVSDLLIASTLAIGGIVMTRFPALVVVGTLAAAIAFACVLDFAKVPVLRRLRII
jgi:H+-transporting ATPase